ncbi:MAG: toll/interleukin-1 receptor domain-containing protein [Chitinophagaceae bacterium]
MAFIKGYKNDIFISYSHIDNAVLPRQTQGWIKQFYDFLTVNLWQSIGTKNISIWWDDTNLDGSVLFNDAIAEEIEGSAIFLCLNSSGYLRSDYCKKELSQFYENAKQSHTGLRVGNRSRLINALLYNIPYSQWPTELSGTSGFPFHDAKENMNDRGHPLQIDTPDFTTQIQDLCDALVALIEQFPEMDPPPPEPAFTIFFGDIADSLRTVRKRTISELEKEGYRVVCNVPPPYEAIEHENAVKEILETASLSVHLLDQYPGKEVDGDEVISYSQKQTEISLLSSKPKLIWVPAELNIDVIEDDQYKTFMQGLKNGKETSKNMEYVVGAKSELTQQIKILVEHLKSSKSSPTENISVLLDTHYNDQLYALELSKSLLENSIQPFINPQDDDPRKNIHILEDRLSQVNKLVLFYGRVTIGWVEERIKAALQFKAASNSKMDFVVLMLPPLKDNPTIFPDQPFIKVNLLNNSDKPQLENSILQQILQIIKL